MSDKHLYDPKGFWRHCEVVEKLFEMGVDPHTRHHISSGIREASNKVHNGNTKSTKEGSHYMSAEAALQIETGHSTELVVDHVVPVSVITEMVFDLREKTRENIGNLIRDWTILAVITHQQHEVLRKSNLYHRMPDSWKKTDSKLARYNHLGIELRCNEFEQRYSKKPNNSSKRTR